MVIKVKDAKYYQIKFTFNDGYQKVLDLKEQLDGPIFEPLKDIDYFKISH